MSSIRSAFHSLSGSLFNLLIGLIGIIILARIVQVEDHGIYALAFAIYLIFQPLLDFGMTPVYLKLSEVNKRVNSSFFTFNLYVGLLISICLIALSPLASRFFNNQVLVPLMFIQALTVILMSLGNQPLSQLFRQKRFFQAEAVRNASAILALIIAVILALYGWGYWALAAKFLLHGFFRVIFSWWVVKPQYNLVPIRELKGYWESIKFGGYITASRLLAGYANNIDKLFVGRVFGESALGHYEKAIVIIDKPNMVRNALTTPAMSHIARLDKSQYASSYRLLIQLFSLIAGLPALFFCSMARR